MPGARGSDVEIVHERPPRLVEYATISIAFDVTRVIDVSTLRPGRSDDALVERAIDRPYVKDYDADPTTHPTAWAERFDLTRWAFFAAFARGTRVGGAAVALDPTALELTEGRPDVAVLWDLRVSPTARDGGIGRRLFEAAAEWARSRCAVKLLVETQDVNVAACRFYRAQGCVLGAIRPLAYEAFPDEVQLLWYKDLAAPRHVSRRDSR